MGTSPRPVDVTRLLWPPDLSLPLQSRLARQRPVGLLFSFKYNFTDASRSYLYLGSTLTRGHGPESSAHIRRTHNLGAERPITFRSTVSGQGDQFSSADPLMISLGTTANGPEGRATSIHGVPSASRPTWQTGPTHTATKPVDAAPAQSVTSPIKLSDDGKRQTPQNTKCSPQRGSTAADGCQILDDSSPTTVNAAAHQGPTQQPSVLSSHPRRVLSPSPEPSIDNPSLTPMQAETLASLLQQYEGIAGSRPSSTVSVPHGQPAIPRGQLLTSPGQLATSSGQPVAPPGQLVMPPGPLVMPPGPLVMPLGQLSVPPGQLVMPPGQLVIPPGQMANSNNRLQQDRPLAITNEKWPTTALGNGVAIRPAANSQIHVSDTPSLPSSSHRPLLPYYPQTAAPRQQNALPSPAASTGVVATFDGSDIEWEASMQRAADTMQEGWYVQTSLNAQRLMTRNQIVSAQLTRSHKLSAQAAHLLASRAELMTEVGRLRRELSAAQKRSAEAARHQSQHQADTYALVTTVKKQNASLASANQREMDSQNKIQSLKNAVELQATHIRELRRQNQALQQQTVQLSTSAAIGPSPGMQAVAAHPPLTDPSITEEEFRTAEHDRFKSDFSKLEKENLTLKENLRKNNFKMGELAREKEEEVAALKSAHETILREASDKSFACIRSLEKKLAQKTQGEDSVPKTHQQPAPKSFTTTYETHQGSASNIISEGIQTETPVTTTAPREASERRIRELSEELTTTRRLLAEKTEEAEKAEKDYAEMFDETEKAYKVQHDELKARMEKLYEELGISKAVAASQNSATFERIAELEKRIDLLKKEKRALEELQRDEADTAAQRETKLKAELASCQHELAVAQALEAEYKEAEARETDLRKQLEKSRSEVMEWRAKAGVMVKRLSNLEDLDLGRLRRRGQSPASHATRDGQNTSSSIGTPLDAPPAESDHVDSSTTKPFRRSVSPNEPAVSQRQGIATEAAPHTPISEVSHSDVADQVPDLPPIRTAQESVSPTGEAMCPSKRGRSNEEPSFLNPYDQESPPLPIKRTRTTQSPAVSDTKTLRAPRVSMSLTPTPRTSSTPYDGVEIDKPWVRDNIILCADCVRDADGDPCDVICKVCL